MGEDGSQWGEKIKIKDTKDKIRQNKEDDNNENKIVVPEDNDW